MRIGVIGAGKVGSLRAQTVKSNPEHELVAVLDQSEDLAKAAVAGTSALATSDLDAFLAKDPEIVIVSTPPHTHADQTQRSTSQPVCQERSYRQDR